VIQEIKLQRQILEEYIKRNPDFSAALGPLNPTSRMTAPPAFNAGHPPERIPDIVLRMISASKKTGVGPMAAVAGAIAQISGEKARNAGDTDVIVDNGGDVYIACAKTVTVGLFAGGRSFSEKLALKLYPSEMPIGICSSSSTMGHSMSFGNCDLATVIAKDTALADAAATDACNRVGTRSDIQRVLQRTMGIPGVKGIIIIKGDQIGIAGDIPELIRNNDTAIDIKIARDNAGA
jgi:hypothetical protein